MAMEFEWSEANREAHLAKHGVDFLDVVPMFAGPTVEQVDDRKDYGETRINALGEVEGRVYFVTYTWRGKRKSIRRRIISARKANHDEQRTYYARHPR
jgi:uncharacterized DUF497 family protein